MGLFMTSKSDVVASHPPAPTEETCLVQMMVTEATGVALAEIFGVRRAPRVVVARQIAMYLCHIVYSINLTQVGGAFGRDRTAASHAARRVEYLRDDAEFDRTLKWLEGMLRGPERQS
jgi:chromosomal replication initiation ATPase DnaA